MLTHRTASALRAYIEKVCKDILTEVVLLTTKEPERLKLYAMQHNMKDIMKNFVHPSKKTFVMPWRACAMLIIEKAYATQQL